MEFSTKENRERHSNSKLLITLVTYPYLKKGLIIKKSGFPYLSANSGLIIRALSNEMLYLYDDYLYYCDTVLSIWASVSPNFPNIARFNFSNTMSSYTVEMYDRFLTVNSTNTYQVKSFVSSSYFTCNFSFFSPLDFKNGLLGLHFKIHNSTIIYNAIMYIITPLLLAVAVNIGTALAFFLQPLLN